MEIHSTSIVDKPVKIPENTTIGPYSIIESDVSLGEGIKIASNVLIKSGTIIGKNCEIFSGAIIGEKPQDLKYNDEKTLVQIGENCIIREYATIHKGTKDRKITKVGSNCLLMTYSHVAHDTFLGDNVILSNNVQVGGHVTIEKNAIVGGSCAIHQFSRIGEAAMIGGMTGVLSDVIPFGLSLGNRNNLMGLNLIGLRRSKISNENIKKIQSAYEIIFKTIKFRENIETLDNGLKNNEFVQKIPHRKINPSWLFKRRES